jgi:hypothetical protein
MADQFLSYVDSLEQSDPVFQTLPKYTNKKKLKELTRDLAEKQKEVDKLTDVKQVKVLLNVLKDKVDRSRVITDKFQNEYNSVKNLLEEAEKLRADLKREEAALKTLTKLEQDMMASRQNTIDRIHERQEQVNREFSTFVEELQAKLKYFYQ